MKHEIFEINPNLKEVHVTSDGECFYNDNDAKMHAKSLENKSIELVLNPDHINVVVEEIEEIEEIEKTKKKVDLSKMNKAKLIEFAKENALELDEALTNKQMVEALTAQLEDKE